MFRSDLYAADLYRLIYHPYKRDTHMENEFTKISGNRLKEQWSRRAGPCQNSAFIHHETHLFCRKRRPAMIK